MDRRSRGSRKSSNCIQSCLTFSFLRFMADPGKKVDSRKLKVKERQDSRKKRQNTEKTECRGTKSTGEDDNSRDMGGPKNKNAPTGVGAHFSTEDSLPEQYLVCQEGNAKKKQPGWRRLAGVGDSRHGNHVAFGEAWTAGAAGEVAGQHSPVLAAFLERHVHDFEGHVLRAGVSHERRGLQVSHANL